MHSGIDSVLCATVSCKGCNRSDNMEAMISCESCNLRWHSSCAEQIAELTHDRPWRCSNCATYCESTSSIRTTSSARLRLKQLDERKALDDKLLEEKARREREFLAERQLLEAEAESERIDNSERSYKTHRSDVQNWLNKQHQIIVHQKPSTTSTSTPIASSLTVESTSPLCASTDNDPLTQPIYTFAAQSVSPVLTKAVVSQHLSTQILQKQKSHHEQLPSLSVHGQQGPQPLPNTPPGLPKSMSVPSKSMGITDPSLSVNRGLFTGYSSIMPPVTRITAAVASESTRIESNVAATQINSVQRVSLPTAIQPPVKDFSWNDISRDLHYSTNVTSRCPQSDPQSNTYTVEKPGSTTGMRVALQSGMPIGIHSTMHGPMPVTQKVMHPGANTFTYPYAVDHPGLATSTYVAKQPGTHTSMQPFPAHVAMHTGASFIGPHIAMQTSPGEMHPQTVITSRINTAVQSSFTRHYPPPISTTAQVNLQPSFTDQFPEPGLSCGTKAPMQQSQISAVPPNESCYPAWTQQPTITYAPGMQYSTWPTNGVISPQQLAARHVVSKDLPKFAGDPLEWPMFLNSFESTTIMCGMQPDENLARLQKSLVGSAREKVQSLLTLPSAIPEIINTLRDECGRPDQLVYCLLAKVRNTPLPDVRKLETLVAFGREVKNLVTYIEASNLHAHLSNPLLLAELVNRLPPNLRLDWGLYSQKLPEVTLKAFSEFALTIKTAACQVNIPSDHFEYNPKRVAKKDKSGFVNTHAVESCRTTQKLESGSNHDTSNQDINTATTNQYTKQNKEPKPCHMCQRKDHRIRDCKKFQKLNIRERNKYVQDQNLCCRCLTGHGKWPCRTKQPCGVDDCKELHHKLLHLTTEKSDIAVSSAIVTAHYQQQTPSLFKIIPITLRNNGKSVDTYAFFDDGSDLTLLEEKLANELGLVGVESPLCLRWTSNVTRRELHSKRVQLLVDGSDGKTEYIVRNVRTVQNLGLPKQSLNYQNLTKQFPFLSGLPVKSYSDAVPGILVGVDNAWLKLPLKIRDRRCSEPVAIKTRLGWTIFGGQHESTGPARCMVHICRCSCDRELQNLVKDYFASEDAGVDKNMSTQTTEDRRALDILEKTTKRTPCGHFETGLLWRQEEVKFPNSYPMAERRLKCLERRLATDPELRKAVTDQIIDYQKLGYVHKATAEELRDSQPQKVWYLPLGVVRNPRKPTKVRVVWDAAATVGGVSLNSMLLKGPDLMTPLLRVLCRFRQRQYAVAGDIRQMFHQLLIRKEDRQSQRFLWRTDPNSVPEVFVMDVATFGATCSPCSAQYVKNLNSQEYSEQFPEAATAIIENTYVDDYLDSRDTIDETIRIANEVHWINSKAGFEVRNWQSNSEHILARVGESSDDSVKSFSLEKLTSTERILGMMWIPIKDTFVFTSQFRTDLEPLLSGDVIPTKRQVLQVVMSLFDPLGIIANYTIHGKILIQDIWRAGTEWDDKIIDRDFTNWRRWVQLLPKLATVQIARCYFPNYKPQSYESIQLHVFVDASEQAYSCVAYFRIIDGGLPRCALISAKAKVTPLRPHTIPRNELSAARLGVRLAKTIIQNHNLPIKKRFFWTDSRTVLSWIRADPRKYRQFVAFRVAEILEETESGEWNWVPTKMNNADEATKWASEPKFDQESNWFRGPDFLYLAETEWPKIKPTLVDPEEELRAVHVHHEIGHPALIEFSRFSCLKDLLQKLAYIYHFINNCRSKLKTKIKTQTVTLTQEDYYEAENSLWRMVQAESYSEELAIVRANSNQSIEQRKRFDKRSPLRKVTPFLDNKGVLRSESRIDPQAAYYCYEFRNPIILPRRYHVTELLILRIHQQFGHANYETVVNELQQKYCIAKLRSEVKRVIKNCMWCRVYRAKPAEPRMAALPQERVQPFVRPFTFTGVDYFGPLIIKIGRSNVKRWVALFTCLTVRATHLEVVHSLSAESCKMAIRRFVARRGSPQKFFSDNGTNFRGVAKELAHETNILNRQIAGSFINASTEWHFNPPSAPHMGGVWERKVRSVKEAFKVLSHQEKLDDEGLVTLLAEAELIVNSHPLTYVPLETSEQKILTPNSFLLMDSSGSNNLDKVPIEHPPSLRTNWKLMQHLLNQFWKRWIQCYLPTIARRTKWFSEVRPIKEGDLVVVVDESVRNGWLRGRVIKTYNKPDNQVRKVDVLTSSGTLQRPATKVAVLDVLEISKTI